MDRPTPLGHERCDRCGTLSPLYWEFPACMECGDHYCSSCMLVTVEADEGHWGKGTCVKCISGGDAT